VDIAIMLNDAGQFNNLKKAMLETGNFTAHPTESIKLFYKDAIEIDLLPFGDIETENRKVTLESPNLFVLNMPGFKEVHPFVQEISIDNGLSIKVCTLEGIILLKLISHNDRPQRNKDITDIEHIISVYFDLNDDDIFVNHFDLMEIYDTKERDYLQLVCARVIGRKLKQLLEGSQILEQQIDEILTNRPTTWWLAMQNGLRD
jgi:predicted nucleotidyltransferase